MGKTGTADKSFVISKQLVWEAFRQVRANRGAAGVDGVSIAAFEADLENNLFKIWNRMSSGTYFPPAVLAVEIPKPGGGGGTRLLGVPTVADRVAQTTAALALQARVETIFHPDSFGYRPGRSALDAVERCRARCWRKDWVIDLDVAQFFDSVPWDLVVQTVQANITIEQRWVLLYVKRWLAAPLAMPDGTVRQRDQGTPQGSAISPVLANLFMHYAFDLWLTREFPTVEFERYADDAVVHCVTLSQARRVLAALEVRMEQVGLRLHPDKTKIVYCKDTDRRGDHEHTSFTFLGYTFRPRTGMGSSGRLIVSFGPAMSRANLTEKGHTVRGWRLHLQTGSALSDLAAQINPIVAGWMNYYGRFRRSEMTPLLQRINTYLMRWAGNKYKRLRPYRRFKAWWRGILDRDPELFTHWRWVRTFDGIQ